MSQGTLDLDNVSGVLTVEAKGGNTQTELLKSQNATGQTLTISQTGTEF